MASICFKYLNDYLATEIRVIAETDDKTGAVHYFATDLHGFTRVDPDNRPIAFRELLDAYTEVIRNRPNTMRQRKIRNRTVNGFYGTIVR